MLSYEADLSVYPDQIDLIRYSLLTKASAIADESSHVYRDCFYLYTDALQDVFGGVARYMAGNGIRTISTTDYKEEKGLPVQITNIKEDLLSLRKMVTEWKNDFPVGEVTVLCPDVKPVYEHVDVIMTCMESIDDEDAFINSIITYVSRVFSFDTHVEFSLNTVVTSEKLPAAFCDEDINELVQCIESLK